jgi:hypothetical protein
MLGEHWRILILRIWTLVPGWRPGAAVCCQEPACSHGASVRDDPTVPYPHVGLPTAA